MLNPLVNSYSFEIVRKGHLIAYEKLLRITITQSYKVMEGMALMMMKGTRILYGYDGHS